MTTPERGPAKPRRAPQNGARKAPHAAPNGSAAAPNGSAPHATPPNGSAPNGAGRYRRSAPERARPLRHTALAFGAVSGAPGGPTPAKPDGAEPGVLERAVQLAYKVCDEYLRGGLDAAASLRPDPSKARETMADETPNPMAMMMSLWTQMGRLWLGAVMPYMGGMGQGTDIFGNPLGAGFAGAAGPAGAVPVSSAPVPVDVTVRVTSARPVVVQVQLADRAKTANLTINALKSIEGAEKGALSAVYIEELRYGVRVNVTVPTDQATGTYRGTFTDAITREPRGTLTITVHDAA